MRSNPEPHDAIVDFSPKRAIALAHTNRPKGSDAFEVQRRVARVCLEKGEILVRDRTDVCRKSLIQRPVARRGIVLQISRLFPD